MRTLVLLVIGAGCLLIESCTPRPSADQKFESLADKYIERFVATNPELATSLGDHRYDTLLSDYSETGLEVQRTLAKSYLDSLSGIDDADLQPVNSIDAKILRTNLESTLYALDTLRENEWNPLAYNVGGAIYGLVARDFAPLRDRLASVKSRLTKIPAVIAAAEANLKNPPKIHTETAILQNDGTIGLIKDDLDAYVDQVPEMKKELAPAREEAVKALKAYGDWLRHDLLPRSNGDFRLGDQKFRRKLFYSLESNLQKEDILKAAESELKKTQDDLYLSALPLFRASFPRITDSTKLADRPMVIKAVLDKLAGNHPTNASIVEIAKTDLNSATAFVRTHNLVSVPDEPIKVIVMPEYQRGVAVAYCDAPGPLEKNGETFFAISPTPKDWTPQRVESFFREYNSSMIQDLAIHEGMPGHYLQLAHSNAFKAPTMVRAIFSNGMFVEGWATYAEQFMAEQGYGGPEVKVEQLKMRLRIIINAILDQKIHTAGMTESEAMALMMKEGFQEEGEAAGKWRRACLSSTQLSTYFVGNTELNLLANAYRSRYPTADDKTVNDAILSVGSPAPKYIRQALGLQ